MKPFAWSWSKLKNFRVCPKRSYHVDIAKDFKEDESEALKWGNLLHDGMAKRIMQGKPLPPIMARYEGWPARVSSFKGAGIDVTCENKMAFAQDLTPCHFFDNAAWCRAVIDVKILVPSLRAAVTIDWKTGGKVQPEFEQLGISAQAIFAHHPEIDEVGTIYVWFGHDTQTVKVYRRADMVPLWNDLNPDLVRMIDAYRTLTYPPTPSGLCVRYCPVTSCPYHGKGTR